MQHARDLIEGSQESVNWSLTKEQGRNQRWKTCEWCVANWTAIDLINKYKHKCHILKIIHIFKSKSQKYKKPKSNIGGNIDVISFANNLSNVISTGSMIYVRRNIKMNSIKFTFRVCKRCWQNDARLSHRLW